MLADQDSIERASQLKAHKNLEVSNNQGVFQGDILAPIVSSIAAHWWPKGEASRSLPASRVFICAVIRVPWVALYFMYWSLILNSVWFKLWVCDCNNYGLMPLSKGVWSQNFFHYLKNIRQSLHRYTTQSLVVERRMQSFYINIFEFF